MLLNPRTPIVVGVVLVFLVVRLLMRHSPMPGGLASAHARLERLQGGLDSCAACHDSRGLAAGCLGCHEEIAAQLEEERGYHHFLLRERGAVCTPCHSEHHGGSFPLVSVLSWGAQVEAAFRHPHVKPFLTGKHEATACAACHKDDARGEGGRSFLGLSTECVSCHEDLHAGGLSGACDACHGEDAFRPTVGFDHGRHFPLAGGHERLECWRCHVLPLVPGRGAERPAPKPLPFPFDRVEGHACADCHGSPHRADFQADCEACHQGDDPDWVEAIGAMTPERHARVGFRLEEPHGAVPCAGCHPRDLPWDERHPEPSALGYLRREDTCEGCHADVHAGQFAARYAGCIDCHDRRRFQPAAWGRDEHAGVFPLSGAHGATACFACHELEPATGVRAYAGTPRICRGCHEDPHGGQFARELAAGDCTACHDEGAVTFRIRPFDHAARAGYALEGAHARASCADCHPEAPAPALVSSPGAPRASAPAHGAGASTGDLVRRYRGTSTECSSCHRDVHRGQFRDGGPAACSSCHRSFTRWQDIDFDHDTGSRFPLRGAHARVSCSRCHQEVALEDGSRVVQYRPLGTECRDCHEIHESPLR
jgi:hypothetical protein